MNPPWGDFGWEMNNLLNRIGNYCKDKSYSPGDAETVFNAGIAARPVFHATHASADTSGPAAEMKIGVLGKD